MKHVLIIVALGLSGAAFWPPLTLCAALYCIWYISIDEPTQRERRYMEECNRQAMKKHNRFWGR